MSDGTTTIAPLVVIAITRNAGAGALRSALAVGLKDRIDEPCVGRDTLLTLAARHGNTECLRLLLEEGASIDAPSAPPSATALYVAAQEGHTKAVRLLLAKRADVTDVVGDGLTPLAVAVHQGGSKPHAECCKLLLEAPQQVAIGAKKLDDCDQNGVNLLLKASFMGHDCVVGHLLRAGASPTHHDATGATALLLACRQGHAKCAQQLIRAGAPLDAAIEDGGTPLHFACRAGAAECVRVLLAAQCDPDAASCATGVRALHVASQCGELECVRLLIDARASVHVEDVDGVPPLYLADAQGHRSIAKLLARAGAARPAQDEQHQRAAAGAPAGASSWGFW